MGRKPNALILQHFNRGAKLNDSSNRYEHTCKACGEKFPKGRIDSLTTHLVKKCPGISVHDRQKALLELNGFSSDAANNPNGGGQMSGPSVELPIARQTWTALETLAEVSRQIGTSEHPGDNNQATTSPDPPRPDQLEVREQYTLDNPPLSYEQHVQRGKKTSTQKSNRGESEGLIPPATFAHMSNNSRSASPNLAMAASSMAAAQAAARFIPDMVDPQLLADDSRQLLADAAHRHISEDRSLEHDFSEANGAIADNFFGQAHDQHGQWILDGNLYPDPNVGHAMPSASPTASSYNRIAINGPLTTEFSTEYGNGQKANKPKVRGKFDNSRRQEVQEVRKIGACIRCRMLKKTCSVGTPCTQCKGIEAARLWKTPCIRTRLDAVLDMYALGLHSILARHDSNSQKNQVKFNPGPFHIDATHYPETGVYATFKALQGQRVQVDGNIDPGLSGDFSTATVRILDDDNDDLPLKLEAYAKRMLPTFIEKETSRIAKIALTSALQLSLSNTTDASGLLTRALDLWASVHILVDGGGWNFSERTSLEIQPRGHGPLIDPALHEKTYALLVLQLEAAAEKKAAQMSKIVINDMERDLLLAKSARSFPHFLVSVILLHCIEKSTWLFQCWEQEEFRARWPLDKKPSHFTSQGDKVSDFLQMVLKHRSILPKVFQKADGTVGSDASQEMSQFFDDCQINYAHVLNQQNNFVFDKSNSSSFEFRFISKLYV